MQTLSTTVHLDPAKRHDFLYLFDVLDGNPNGDPDNGNMPRTDPETMHGIVTDVAIKRKIRDWVDMTRGTEEHHKIYIQNKGIALNDLHTRAYTAQGLKSTGTKQKAEDVEKARSWMCENFYEIRMFGAVMNTSINCGQVRGPIQLTFARSIDPIAPLDLAITRVAITQSGTDKTTEMGRKAIIPYALYAGHGYYIPHFAKQTGVTSEDLELFWTAMQNMWDTDRSAARGTLTLRGCYIYTHQNPLGNAPAHRLLERVQVRLVEGTTLPRSFGNYKISVDNTNLPDGVTLTTLEG